MLPSSRQPASNSAYLSPTDFYNSIADEYDKLLTTDECDVTIRKEVQKLFVKLVRGKTVMDFGGGTGLDLPWLMAHFDTVYFCEPSEGMREQAKKKSTIFKHPVIFLENDKVHFQNWSSNDFYVDGVLANFAVLNCIANLEDLFTSTATITRPGSCIVALMLNTTPGGNLRHTLHFFLSRLFKKEKAQHHEVFRHSVAKIKESSASYFTLQPITTTQNGRFMIVHLVRNDSKQ